MAIFEIYANSDPEQARLVRDKGSIFALVFPAVWLAWHRLWYELAIYLCVAVFFLAIGNTSWVVIAGVFSFLPGFYLFLEGPGLLARKHLVHGFRLLDVIEADNFSSAELKWFSKPISQRPGQPVTNSGIVTRSAIRPLTDRPEFGLFAKE